MDPSLRAARRPPTGFPRRRGDGPESQAPGTPELKFPPQARGWTHSDWVRTLRAAVSPAGAGMDRPEEERGAVVVSFPRRRGDGPQRVNPPRKPLTFPPQARGWTSDRFSDAADRYVSPAGAGMDPRPRARTARPPGFPRRRGDGPQRVNPPRKPLTFPPQARGWTSDRFSDAADRYVSPAGAGMDPRPRARTARPPGFPRRRGDGPRGSAGAVSSSGFPPQARGWTEQVGVARRFDRVSPAGAGMDPTSFSVSSGLRSFPRRRGDGPEAA